jgi:hypothetical protein
MMSSKSEGISIRVGIGVPWFTLWIFTIAFSHLGFLQGCAALVIWPYYLGDTIATLLGVPS